MDSILSYIVGLLPKRFAAIQFKRVILVTLVAILLFLVFKKYHHTPIPMGHYVQNGRDHAHRGLKDVHTSEEAGQFKMDKANLERIKDALEKMHPKQPYKPPQMDHSSTLPDSEIFVYDVHDMGADGNFVVFVRGLREEVKLHIDFAFCMVGNIQTKLLLINVETFLCKKLAVMPEEAIVTVSYRTRDLASMITWGMRRDILHGKPYVPFCISTLMKDEQHNVDDWIRYHTRQGVQRFLIYDNNSTDNTPKILDSHPHVTRVFWPWSKTQSGAFTHALLQTRHVCNRTLLIDVDEYMFPRVPGVTARDLIFYETTNLAKARNGDPSPIAMCFRVKIMGTSNWLRRPNKTLAEAYIHYDTWYPAERGKCAIQPDRCWYTASVHQFPTNYSDAIVNRVKMHVVHFKYQCWDCYVANKWMRERPSPRSKNFNLTRHIGKVDKPTEKWVGNPGLLDVEFRDYKRKVDKWPYPMNLFT